MVGAKLGRPKGPPWAKMTTVKKAGGLSAFIRYGIPLQPSMKPPELTGKSFKG